MSISSMLVVAVFAFAACEEAEGDDAVSSAAAVKGIEGTTGGDTVAPCACGDGCKCGCAESGECSCAKGEAGGCACGCGGDPAKCGCKGHGAAIGKGGWARERHGDA